MINVRGFVVVAAFVLVAATILAQPILLEINTNFVAHKLEPSGNFSSRNLGIENPKGFGRFAIFPIQAKLSFVKRGKVVQSEGETLAIPQKEYKAAIEVIGGIEFATPKMARKNPLGQLSLTSSFTFRLPTITFSKPQPSFTEVSKVFKGFKVEDINASKGIYLSVVPFEFEKELPPSFSLLEMKKKITAYSPLGGLETIGKYIREDKYAFWATQKNLGMKIDTSLISNWITYNYERSYISNLSSSFDLGPFAFLISMKEGSVSGKIFTHSNISFGAAVSSESTVSLFAELPISLGDFKAFVGGKYIVESSPTVFEPSVTLQYDLENFSPYISYSYEDSVPNVRAGFIANALTLDGEMSLEATSVMKLMAKYFSPIGIVEAAFDTKDNLYSGSLRISSKPFGFDPVQFSVGALAQLKSNGSYNLSGMVNMNFRFFFSYVEGWIRTDFNGISPTFSYGAEVDF